MKKDTEKETEKQEPEALTGYQDEYAGMGGSYLYDPVTKTRKPIKDKESK